MRANCANTLDALLVHNNMRHAMAGEYVYIRRTVFGHGGLCEKSGGALGGRLGNMHIDRRCSPAPGPAEFPQSGSCPSVLQQAQCESKPNCVMGVAVPNRHDLASRSLPHGGGFASRVY